MNPEHTELSGLPLPQSQAPVGGYSFATPPSTEQGSSLKPYPVSTVPAAPAAHTPTQPVPPILITPASIADSDDTDEVDEAWLTKAREIVDQTRDDPYTQTIALARLRTDFQKNRYGKDIKMSKDVAR